jgi:hypothetical protein
MLFASWSLEVENISAPPRSTAACSWAGRSQPCGRTAGQPDNAARVGKSRRKQGIHEKWKADAKGKNREQRHCYQFYMYKQPTRPIRLSASTCGALSCLSGPRLSLSIGNRLFAPPRERRGAQGTQEGAPSAMSAKGPFSSNHRLTDAG